MAPVLIGLQLNVCSVELSVYCGPHCVVCPYPEDTWLVHGLPGLCSSGNLTLSKLSIWEPVWIQESVSLGSKVRATSFILLLGVGSFVCYRLFHQLKRRLTKGSKRPSESKTLPAKLRKLSSSQRKYLDYLLYDHDDLSSLSNSDISDTSSCASYGDGETTSDTPSLSDGDSESMVMGVSSSNPFEPVYFSKASGIHFRGNGQKNCTPLDHLARNVSRHNSTHKCHLFPNNEFHASDHKENVFSCSGSFNSSGSYLEYQDFENSNNFDTASYDVPFMSHDAASMHGNFSPGSLRERTLRTEQLISSKLENTSKSNHHILKRDYSVDSLTYNSEQEFSGPASKRSLSRTLSIDSEVSELCVELQRHAEEVHEMGIVTVEKMENLEDEINNIKQTVLELDADLVGLKVYKKPPANCWELTNISESDQSLSSEINNSGVVDVIHHHKNKMWCKGLLDKPQEGTSEVVPENSNGVTQSPKWDQVCNRLLDWDVSVDNPFENEQVSDSGSDFGNSLETDSPDVESVSVNGATSVSLEWDTNFASEIGVNPFEEVDSSFKAKKLHHSSKSPVQSKSLQEDHSSSFKKKHRSQSIPSEVLSKQIQQALRKRTPVSQSGCMNLSVTSYASQLPSPMTEAKTEMSPMQEGATSLFSDMTFSSEDAFKSNISADNTGSTEAMFENKEDRNKSNRECLQEFQEEEKDRNGNLSSTIVKNVNRDSAYCEGSDFPEVVPVENVGPEVDIQLHIQQQEYAQQNKQLSQLIKKGYEVVDQKLHSTHIRRIKGDNYGVIRAGLYQILSEGLPVLQNYGGAAAVYQLLSSWAKDNYPWLLDWTFAESLPYNNSTCLQGFWVCLHSLENMEATLCKVTDRGQHLAAALNGNPDLDVQLLEAVKLLMCVSACELYSGQTLSSNVPPVFVMLLFAREESPTPRELVLNRLNKIGQNHRLQQVEIYLLGYSMSVTLRIVRFSQFGSQEFITYYPDCNLGSWKEITLVAEDEAHFNVLTR